MAVTQMNSWLVVTGFTCAIRERGVHNSDVVGDNGGDKTGATIKRRCANAGDARWNGDRGKRRTLVKCVIADADQVLPQVYRGSVLTRHARYESGLVDHACDVETVSVTTWKRGRCNGVYAVCNDDGRKRGASLKRILINKSITE